MAGLTDWAAGQLSSSGCTTLCILVGLDGELKLVGALLHHRLALCLLMLLGSRLINSHKDDWHGVRYDSDVSIVVSPTSDRWFKAYVIATVSCSVEEGTCVRAKC